MTPAPSGDAAAALTSRASVRAVKKLLRRGTCAEAGDPGLQRLRAAALALLERSVRMRHKRLAVQRLGRAVELGAEVPVEHWAYCRQVAAGSRDAGLQSSLARTAPGLQETARS